MIKRLVILTLPLALLLAAPFAVSAQDGPWIEGFGTFGTGSNSYSVAISTNGLVAVANAPTNGAASTLSTRFVLWNNPGPAQLATGVPAEWTSFVRVNDLNANGTVAVGVYGASGSNFLWNSSTGFQALSGIRTATGISGNGTTVVGESFSITALKWTASGGVIDLGGTNANAQAANFDGSVAVGVSSDRAALWGSNNALVSLGTLPGYTNSSIANSVSGDGAIVVGRSSSTNGSRAFRWTLETGMQDIGSLNESDAFTVASFISVNGTYIMGNGSSGGFLWTEAGGMVSLLSYMEAGNVDLTGWSGLTAAGISEDGRYLTGTGSYNGTNQAYVAYIDVIPEPSTYALLALAAAGLGGYVLRRRRR